MTVTQTRPTLPPSAPGEPAAHWIARAADLADRIAVHAAGHDRAGTFVAEAFDLLRDEGFLTALVPAEFGGGGVDHTTAGQILTELAKGCPSTAVALSMHYHLVATQVWRHKHDQPAEAVLRKVADGAVLISTGAADWVDSTGRAVRVEGGFRVTAEKRPASGAPIGTILVTSVPWPDGPDGPQVIHCAVPFAADGVDVRPTWDAMGLRGTGSDTVTLTDVFVPDAAVSLIRPSGAWHPVWNAVLGAAMPLIMAAYRGIAEAAAELALGAAAARSDDPITRSLAGALTNHLVTAQDAVDAMFASSGDLTFAATAEHSARVLARKTVAAEACIATVRSALDLCGGAGFAVDFGLERLFRDVHGALHHPLPAARQHAFTGRIALGLDPVG